MLQWQRKVRCLFIVIDKYNCEQYKKALSAHTHKHARTEALHIFCKELIKYYIS
jgi:hypothetical protein